MLNANAIVGSHNIALITLDTLRYDVACAALRAGDTPNLARLLPSGTWERRHTPGSFTYAAHHAFFAGFLPTPARPGRHTRLFAARFGGSETSGAETFVFDAPDIVSGLGQAGYHTICIGGVGFFNKTNPLSSVLPALFAESHWRPELGVTNRDSTRLQVELAVASLKRLSRTRRAFLFVNISALHQPNCMYVPGAEHDTPATQQAALAYVDRQLPPLFAALRRRGPALVIVCADHGTAYGEDGFAGHRIGHPSVWDVPYAEFVLPEEDSR